MTDQRIRVLLAEDEANLSQILTTFLRGRGYEVTPCPNGREALECLRSETFDVALLDIVMPEMDGLEVLRAVRSEPEPPEVIIITGNGTIETAISAMRLGAYDYMSKPYRMAEIDLLVRRAWEKRQLLRQNQVLQSRLSHIEASPEVTTRHAPLAEVLGVVERVARSESPVLISGESGTGKELIARMLHRMSERGGPLVDVNCAAITGPTVEAELFGFEQTNSHGTIERKAGLIELAAGGTLFLDEVSELEAKVQGKLLRALEQGSFFRVGGTRKVEVSVRVVAATNRDLAALVAEGKFRTDLYYRINAIALELPPLRDRRVDIPMLAAEFLRKFGGANPPVLAPDALDALKAYPWPGNVRELRNVIERAVLIGDGRLVRATDLPLRAPGAALAAAAAGAPGAGSLSVSLSDLERRHIESVLNQTNWHQGRAASALGISSKTLYRKIREYGFNRPERLG
ncbi:MAG: sigma-54-dependent Fis family transcriptional regulator [Gemmatimonadaceae bacterium]|nr:sigma-54-dependent Fis family transcriptional regulator [Gemmatimonadaceae bacterium]